MSKDGTGSWGEGGLLAVGKGGAVQRWGVEGERNILQILDSAAEATLVGTGGLLLTTSGIHCFKPLHLLQYWVHSRCSVKKLIGL